jgi:hypothetical protein
MNTRPNRVAVVLDPDYGDRLMELARRAHVWAIDSVKNQLAINHFAEDLKNRNATKEEKELSLTIAHLNCLDSAFLETLEEHHGEYAQNPPWNELQVIGAQLDLRIQKILEKYGFTIFENTADGFLAKK